MAAEAVPRYKADRFGFRLKTPEARTPQDANLLQRFTKVRSYRAMRNMTQLSTIAEPTKSTKQ